MTDSTASVHRFVADSAQSVDIGPAQVMSSVPVEPGTRVPDQYGEGMGLSVPGDRSRQRGRRMTIDGIEGDRVPKGFTAGRRARFSRGVWGIGRTVVATILALAGALGVVGGVTLQWLEDAVVERDGFAQISQDLAMDQTLQDELVATAVDNASSTVQQQDLGGMPFGGAIRSILDDRVTSAIEDYAQSDQYVDDWNQVMLTTHELNIEPAGTHDSEGAPENLEIYAAPVVDSIETRMEDRIGFGVELNLRSDEALGGEDGILVVQQSNTGPVFDTIADTTARAPLALWGGIVALVLSLVIARHREWPLIGGGLGLLAGVLYVGNAAQEITDTVVASPDLQDVGRSVVERIFQLLLTGLDTALAPLLWTGVVAGILGALATAARVLWRWGSGDSWDASHTVSDERRRRRVVEV